MTLHRVRRGTLDPRTFNRLRITAACSGSGNLSVFVSDGNRLITSSREVELRVVAQGDLGRTLLNLAGLHGIGFPGEDLRRYLEVEQFAAAPHFALHANRVAASITSGDNHLVLVLQDETSVAQRIRHRVELYDLSADPGCNVNLVDEELDLARDMRAALIDWLCSERELGLRGLGQADSRLAAQLIQLGYAGEDPASDVEYWVEDDCHWCERFE